MRQIPELGSPILFNICVSMARRMAVGSYAYRGMDPYAIGELSMVAQRRDAISESVVVAPSDTYAISDSRMFSDAGYGKPGGESLLNFSRHLHTELKGRHPAYNIVCCDGHVEAVKRIKLFEKSEQWSRRWFFDDQAHRDFWPFFDDP